MEKRKCEVKFECKSCFRSITFNELHCSDCDTDIDPAWFYVNVTNDEQIKFTKILIYHRILQTEDGILMDDTPDKTATEPGLGDSRTGDTPDGQENEGLYIKPLTGNPVGDELVGADVHPDVAPKDNNNSFPVINLTLDDG